MTQTKTHKPIASANVHYSTVALVPPMYTQRMSSVYNNTL